MDSSKDPEVSYVSDKVLEATLKAEIKQVAFVYDHMREYFASLMPQANPGTKKHQISSMYFRVQAWMSTLTKLDHMGDVQAVICGLRALLELATDMLLLHKDMTNKSVLKIDAWSESAWLKYAQLVTEYAKRRRREGAKKDYAEYATFIAKNQARIEENRKQLWPRNGTTTKHPERWSGRSNLLSDIREVDSYFSNDIHRFLREGLEELYETEYRRWNWFVHGSGLSGFSRHHSFLYLMSSLALARSTRLALLCCEIYLREIDFDIRQQKSNPFDDLESIRMKLK